MRRAISPAKRSNQGLRIAVIGAGSAGLTATKALQDQGFSPTCYEMSDRVGGLWVLGNKNGRGGAYRSLHINTSTLKMQFSDFPMRRDIGDFPAHEEIASYFQAYAEHFSLLRRIRFSTEVVKCVPIPSGYRLIVRERLSGAESEELYDALIVANGHHFDPSYPTPLPGRGFGGHVMHSGEYIDPKTPYAFQGKKVLVVGMGNSAMDIACELSNKGHTKEVHVSTRRGAWVLPKYILGKPLDQGSLIPSWLPQGLKRRIATRAFQMIYGKMSRFGLPEPDHLIGEAHPTVSDAFPTLVRDGKIHMRRAIRRAELQEVSFEDGQADNFDVIVYCTGYKLSFPFFEANHLAAPGNHIPLFLRAFHPTYRRVFFVGLAQTIGAIMPVAESQSRAIAAHLKGEYNLPSVDAMKEAIQKNDHQMAKRFVTSPRHTMQVDPELFQKSLQREREQGMKRALDGAGTPFPTST